VADRNFMLKWAHMGLDYIPEGDRGALNTLPEPPAPAKPADLPSNVVSLFGRKAN